MPLEGAVVASETNERDPGECRCLIALPDFNGGGAEAMCLALLRRWPGDWPPPHILVKCNTGELRSQFEGLGFRIDVVGDARTGVLNWLRLVLEVRRCSRSKGGGKVSCVVSFLTTVPCSVALIGKRDVKHVISSQNPPMRQGLLRRVALRWAGRRCTTVVGIAPGIREEWRSLGISAEKLEVVPNCVNVASFAEDQEGAGFGAVGPRIAVIARLDRQKRIDRALSVFARYATSCEGETPELAIYGSGPLEQDVVSWASSYDFCGGKVELKGFTDDVAGALRQSDCLLVTSDFEGFGNVIVEALATGVPVVSSKVPYGPEFIIGFDRRLGVLCESDDLECFVRALRYCVSSRHDPCLVRARRDRAMEFDEGEVVSRWLAAIAAAVS